MENNCLDKWMSETNFFIICIRYESIKFSIEDILTWWCMIDISSHRICITISSSSRRNRPTSSSLSSVSLVREKTWRYISTYSGKLLIYKFISHIIHSAIISEESSSHLAKLAFDSSQSSHEQPSNS